MEDIVGMVRELRDLGSALAREARHLQASGTLSRRRAALLFNAARQAAELRARLLEDPGALEACQRFLKAWRKSIPSSAQ
jgi:hypothetical protein